MTEWREPKYCPKGHRALNSGYCPKCKTNPNQGKRGPDKIPRDKKSFAARYMAFSGRNVERDMWEQQKSINEMQELANNVNDPEKKFKMLAEVNKAQAAYNRIWTPYLEHKLGSLETEQTAEDQISLDDALAGVVDDTKY